MRLKHSPLLLVWIILCGCTQQAPVQTTAAVAKPNGNRAALNLAPVASTRSYDELITIFSRATGVHQSRMAIRYSLSMTHAQLPLNNDPNSFSDFNQLAITNLANAFCLEYITDNWNPANNHILGFPVRTGTLTVNADKIADRMIEQMAYTKVEDDPFLATVREAMIGSLNAITISEISALRYDISIPCTVFLASNYFTLE